MKRRYLIMTAVATLIIGCTVSAALRQRRAHHRFNDRLLIRLTRQLDLTGPQQAQIRSILEAERSQLEPLFIAASKNRQQLQASTAGGKFDEVQVRALAAQQAETMSQLIVEKERAKARIYNEVLTAEQRSRADQILDRQNEGFHDRFRNGAEAALPAVP